MGDGNGDGRRDGKVREQGRRESSGPNHGCVTPRETFGAEPDAPASYPLPRLRTAGGWGRRTGS